VPDIDLSDWVKSDLASWLALAGVVVTIVITWLAFKRRPSVITFGGIWDVAFRHGEDPKWGELVVKGRMGVASLSTSYVIQKAECRVMVGKHEYILDEQDNVGQIHSPGQALALRFVKDGATVATDVSQAILRGAVRLTDGSTEKINTWATITRKKVL
jgi:hypothetical protein